MGDIITQTAFGCQEVHAWLGEQFMVHMCVALRKFLYKTKSRAYLAVLQGKVLYLYVRGLCEKASSDPCESGISSWLSLPFFQFIPL